MRTLSIKDITQSNDRYKLFLMKCNQESLTQFISFLETQNIKSINFGKELSAFIDGIEDYTYLNYDVVDFVKKIMDRYKVKINSEGNDIVAIYNLGILLEPRLELNAIQLLKEFSKSAALIIIWENKMDIPDILNWPSQQNKFVFDFTDMQLKEVQYAI